MKECFGDIWDFQRENDGAALAITTNGVVRQDGACVMGRGVALQARQRYPGIEYALGRMIREGGNLVHRLISDDGDVFYSFPVKHHWREQADLDLIRASAMRLNKIVVEPLVFVPRPGCGNGGRSWEEVKPIISDILDDRFIVVTYR